MTAQRWGRRVLALFALLLLCPLPAWAAGPRIRLTGPPKEWAQMVGEAFTIGVASSGIDKGWISVTWDGGQQILPLAKRRTNYLPFTPVAAGVHTIMAIGTISGNAKQYTSTVQIKVYPTDAAERAHWMAELALANVGSTDAARYVAGTSLKAEDDWCATFIGWCAKQNQIPFAAGLQASFAGVDVYAGQVGEIVCRTCRGNHLARFRATVLNAGDTLQPGDLVFFIWGTKVAAQERAHPGYREHWHGNASHVGIVTTVQDDVFTFVHGNVRLKGNRFGVVSNQSTDAKEGKTYADWVVAFARPHYDTVAR